MLKKKRRLNEKYRKRRHRDIDEGVLFVAAVARVRDVVLKRRDEAEKCANITKNYNKKVEQIFKAEDSGKCNKCCKEISLWHAAYKTEEAG